MNKTLKETREMKDSGIQWIGEIPKTWQLPLLGSHFKERSEKVNDKDFPPLSVTKKGVVPQLENVAKTDNNDNRKKVCINDFVINSRSDRKGSSGLSKYEGSTSNISIVLQLKDIFPMYAHYLLKSHGFIEEFYRWGSGIVADLWSTRYSSMKKINIPLPPLHEQEAIANYLDQKVGKIDELITEQNQAIENWKDYKQSLITETVTKGLNSNSEMKDSEVEWIGIIPAHWKVYPIKYVGNFVNGYAFSSNSFMDQGVRVLKISNIQHMRLDWSDQSFINKDLLVGLNKYCLKEGDLIFALTRPIISSGIKASIFNLKEKVYINQRNAYFRSSNKLSSKWLLYIMLNYSFIQEFEMHIDKTGQQPNISTKDIGEIKIPLPSLDEQQVIVNFLDEKCLKIDQMITQKQALIKQLEEYKQSLIYECVTGKRCVL